MKDWKKILDDDFVKDFDRDIYVSRKHKIVISRNFVEDHNDIDITKRVKDHSNNDEWVFIFNEPPSEKDRSEIIKKYE